MRNDYIFLKNKIEEENWPVVIYGLGQLGRFIGVELLSLAGIKPQYACDKNENAIGSFIKEHVSIDAMSIKELYSYDRDIVVFICVGVGYVQVVCEEMASNQFIHVITIDDVTSQDAVLECFYGISNINENALSKIPYSTNSLIEKSKQLCDREKEGRVAVYTCITGDYDIVKEPLCIEDNCDYYLISDKRPENLLIYKWIDTKDVVPRYIDDNAVINRWCKLGGYKIFKEYRYSIYLDGSIKIINPISKYIDNIGYAGIALHKHSLRDCIYEEGLRIFANRRGNYSKEAIIKQMLKYNSLGMPRHYGLFECGVIVTDHNNSIMIDVMEQWFNEYINSIRRDQFSFPYILWKNGIEAKYIGVLNEGKDIRKNTDLLLNEKHGT